MTEDRWVELARRLREFNLEREWGEFHTPKNLAMALSSEVGELTALLRWRTAELSEASAMDEATLSAVRDEIGDALLILLTLCERLRIDPVDAARAKLGANAAKYPTESARGASSFPSSRSPAPRTAFPS